VGRLTGEAVGRALSRFGTDRMHGGDRRANFCADHRLAQHWTDQLAANRRSGCERYCEPRRRECRRRRQLSTLFSDPGDRYVDPHRWFLNGWPDVGLAEAASSSSRCCSLLGSWVIGVGGKRPNDALDRSLDMPPHPRCAALPVQLRRVVAFCPGLIAHRSCVPVPEEIANQR
jgi:hypothetical protein